MGYCKICRRSMTDPFDCDCRCEKCGEEQWYCERMGCVHDWHDAGDLGRDEYEHITGMAECNNCGKVSSDPDRQERCPA